MTSNINPSLPRNNTQSFYEDLWANFKYAKEEIEELKRDVLALQKGKPSVITMLPKEGFAAEVTGGEGGIIFEVNNTNDRGPGSFREAVLSANANSPNPSIVSFDLPDGSVIDITSTNVRVTGENITITGANSTGRFLVKRSTDFRQVTIGASANNILLEHLRFHRGLGNDGQSPVHANNASCVMLFGTNIYIRHCTFAWGEDVNLPIFGTTKQNITVQYCMIYEALRHGHQPYGNGYDSSAYLLNISRSSVDPVQDARVTIAHCVLAHGNERQPQIQDQSVEVINCVHYNHGRSSGVIPVLIARDRDGNELWTNVQGCIFISGPDGGDMKPIKAYAGNGNEGWFYANDLVWQKRDLSIETDIANIVDDEEVNLTETINNYNPLVPVPVTVLPSNQVWDHLKDRVGAIQPQRSHSDQRIIDQIDAVLATAYGGKGGPLPEGSLMVDTPVGGDLNENPRATNIAYPFPATWSTVLTG